jgi:hypothetical protein
MNVPSKCLERRNEADDFATLTEQFVSGAHGWTPRRLDDHGSPGRRA